MFSPIKSLITYIQKNTTGNSIFGGNNVTEITARMETANKETVEIEANMQPKSEILKEICQDDTLSDDVAKQESEQNKDSLSDADDSISKCNVFETKSAIVTENSCEYQEDDDYDIEEQIGSSIMLKTPVKVPTTNSSEILELKKASNANRSIFISHDLNRSQTLTPIDDELEDFRHDPMEVLGTTSSPCLSQTAEDFCSIDSAEEAGHRDYKILECSTEDEADGNKTEDEQKPAIESDLDVVEEKDIEIENEQNNANDLDDEEELFLKSDHYKSK